LKEMDVMESETIVATRREAKGTKVTRRLRAQGQLPAIIYGQGENKAIALPAHEVEVALAHGTHTLHISLDGEEQQYLIRDVQYDYLGSTPIHLDLTQVDIHEVVEVTIQIELRGTPEGISQGGVLDQVRGELTVRCRVTDIPELVRPSVSKLGLGETLHVSDIELPEGVEAVTDGSEAVAVVRAIVEEEPEPAEEEEEGKAEPEVIGREKSEEEGQQETS
jgi:large subunit ribosomal protein L25